LFNCTSLLALLSEITFAIFCYTILFYARHDTLRYKTTDSSRLKGDKLLEHDESREAVLLTRWNQGKNQHIAMLSHTYQSYLYISC